MPSPVAIQVAHLTRIYASRKNNAPTIANKDINLEIHHGEIFGLLGSNGAGKTTLILQLMGLLRPTSGHISIEGIDVVNNPDAVKQFIGFLPQTGLPMRFVEVQKALYFTGRLRGQNESDAKMQTQQLLEELQLQSHAKTYVNHLSGGMLRLTNFAMTLMGHPKVLILDEPTNELDPNRRRMVWEQIKKLNQKQGVTCLLVTHNLLEAEQVVRRVAVMHKGSILKIGTPSELKSDNGTNRIQVMLRCNPDYRFSSEQQSLLKTLGRFEATSAGNVTLSVAKESLAHATNIIVQNIGLENLEDFRIQPPSLEDVYLNLGLDAEKTVP